MEERLTHVKGHPLEPGTDNPWTTLSSRIVYSNDWITVREDDVIRPDGKPGIYSVVDTRIATGILALTESKELYLVGQYRYPMGEYSWEIIEGGTDPGESPLEAAKRELLEEAGLKAQTWQLIGHEIHLSNCFSSERGWLFLATDLSVEHPCPDGTEVLALKRLPFRECLNMALAGDIKDALSLLGILLLNQRLNALPQSGHK